jgi:hypothetical protein
LTVPIFSRFLFFNFPYQLADITKNRVPSVAHPRLRYTANMKRIFLLEKLGDGILATETTNVGPQAQFSPSVQHKPWPDIESYFLGLGVTQQVLDACHRDLEKNGSATLTVDWL